MLQVPIRISSRIADGIKQFQPLIESAKKRDINESDTVVLMTGIISEILGFDKYNDITTEVPIRGTFCDLALKIDNKVQIIVEAKAIGIELKDHHVKQGIDYAANKGLEWVVLSNAINWRVYKVIFSKPINYSLVCEVDFLSLDNKADDDIQKLFILTKEAVSKNLLEDVFTQKQATSKFIIGNLLYFDPIISAIRKELRQLYPDIKVDTEEVKNVLLNDVLKREIIEGDEADDAKKKITKMYRKKEKLEDQKVTDTNIPDPASITSDKLN